MKKDLVIQILKFISFIATAVASFIAGSALSSCTVTSDFSRLKANSPTVVAPVKVSQDGLSITKDSIKVDSFNVR